MSHSRTNGGFGTFLVLFAVGFGAFLAVPGLLVVFALAVTLGVVLDPGQLWVFGVTVAALGFALAWLARGVAFAVGAYMTACFGTCWLLAMAHWGFHEPWPKDFFREIVPAAFDE